MSDDDWDDNCLAPTPSSSYARVATNERSSPTQKRITDNLALSDNFKNKHINGSHDPRPWNTVADFKSAKYKSAIRIQNVKGRKPGQIKVITKYPSKYFESGFKDYGEEGEAYFLLTGIKTGKRFVAQHLDCMLTKRYDGKFETPEGNIYICNSDSDTAEYSSGHNLWGASEGENNNSSGETEYFTCSEITEKITKMDLKIEKDVTMKRKLNEKSKESNESSDSEDLITFSMKRRRKVTMNDHENSVKSTESTENFETSDKDLYEPENTKKKKFQKKKNERKTLSNVKDDAETFRFKCKWEGQLLDKRVQSILTEYEEFSGRKLSEQELYGYYNYLMATEIFKFTSTQEKQDQKSLLNLTLTIFQNTSLLMKTEIGLSTPSFHNTIKVLSLMMKTENGLI